MLGRYLRVRSLLKAEGHGFLSGQGGSFSGPPKAPGITADDDAPVPEQGPGQVAEVSFAILMWTFGLVSTPYVPKA